jgi:hypothetical protein
MTLTKSARLHIVMTKPEMRTLRAERRRSGLSLGEITRRALAEYLAGLPYRVNVIASDFSGIASIPEQAPTP